MIWLTLCTLFIPRRHFSWIFAASGFRVPCRCNVFIEDVYQRQIPGYITSLYNVGQFSGGTWDTIVLNNSGSSDKSSTEQLELSARY